MGSQFLNLRHVWYYWRPIAFIYVVKGTYDVKICAVGLLHTAIQQSPLTQNLFPPNKSVSCAVPAGNIEYWNCSFQALTAMLHEASTKYILHIISQALSSRKLVSFVISYTPRNIITVTPWWGRWCLKSPASRLFAQALLDSPPKGPVTRKMFPFDDVIMFHWCNSWHSLNTLYLYILSNKIWHYYFNCFPRLGKCKTL